MNCKGNVIFVYFKNKQTFLVYFQCSLNNDLLADWLGLCNYGTLSILFESHLLIILRLGTGINQDFVGAGILCSIIPRSYDFVKRKYIFWSRHQALVVR